MKRPLIVLLNAVLGIAAVACVAKAVATLVGGFLAESAPPVVAATVVEPMRAQEWDDRKVIIERNLFNVSTLAPKVTGDMDSDQRYAKTRLPLRLLGTAWASNPELSWAAIEDIEARRHLVARVNDRLKGQATVLRIERRRVVLENSGRREELALAESAEGANVSVSPSASVRARGAHPSPLGDEAGASAVDAAVQRLGENSYAVPRTEVETYAQNPAALLSQARFLPRYEQSQMVGMQVNAIRPGSFWEQVGLQDGDVVSQVNGVMITTPEESQRAIQEFSAGRSLRVTVTGRDGQVRQLEYEVQ